MISEATFLQFYLVQVTTCAVQLLYVMQKAGQDPIYKDEEWWLRSLTRIGFIAAAAIASMSYFFGPTPVNSLLLAAAQFILGINMIKLHRRNAHPPADKARIKVRWHERVY